MGKAIAGVLPEAIGVAISPVPIIAVVLMLATPKGESNGLAFLIGWLVGLFAVGSIVLLVADPAGASTETGPAPWVGWLLLLLGAFAVLAGILQFRKRPKPGEEPAMPGWMKAIDKFTAGRAASIGLALAAVNPKNLMLTVAAAAAIAGAGLDGGESFLALSVFVLVGSLGLAIPIVIYFLGGAKAAASLEELRQWLAIHNPAIMTVLFVIIGMKLVGNGLETLLT